MGKEKKSKLKSKNGNISINDNRHRGDSSDTIQSVSVNGSRSSSMSQGFENDDNPAEYRNDDKTTVNEISTIKKDVNVNVKKAESGIACQASDDKAPILQENSRDSAKAMPNVV